MSDKVALSDVMLFIMKDALSLGLDGWKGPPGVDFCALLAADRWIAVLQWLDG